jgi:hypothetical protein
MRVFFDKKAGITDVVIPAVHFCNKLYGLAYAT